jgi:predicted NAD/FAD-binding protein
VTWTDPGTGDWREVGPFASVIMATHANAAQQCLAALDPVTQPNLGAVLQNLAGYQYEASTAYIHTDARLMPVDVNAWRSFNIHIFEYDGPGPYNVPYTISYLENRHQNDALNLSYCLNPYNPQFFTTLNPPTDLLPRYILQTPTGQPAVKTFYHNVATMSTIGLQRDLATLQEQGALRRIYFTGGYTLGVGLHEECWISANHAARRAIGRPVSAALETYATTQPGHEKPAHYAPRYLRHALRAR